MGVLVNGTLVGPTEKRPEVVPKKDPGSLREELSVAKKRFASIRVIRDQVFLGIVDFESPRPT